MAATVGHMVMYGRGLYIAAPTQGLSRWSDNWLLFSAPTYARTRTHALPRPSDRLQRAMQLLYLSAGVCLGHRGARCVCRRLCTGVPRPCLRGDSAGVPLGGWAGAAGRWEGV